MKCGKGSCQGLLRPVGQMLEERCAARVLCAFPLVHSLFLLLLFCPRMGEEVW